MKALLLLLPNLAVLLGRLLRDPGVPRTAKPWVCSHFAPTTPASSCASENSLRAELVPNSRTFQPTQAHSGCRSWRS